MVYCETIEESKTWTCPKSGIWKVICVGGGGAGSAHNAAVVLAIGTSGKTTSFGNYISAVGGISGEDINGGSNHTRAANTPAFGINGYNGAAEYGSPSGDYIGTGYGASGGAYSKDGAISNAGLPGNVKSIIIDIDAGTSIPCTIGAGGSVTKTGTGNDSAKAGTNAWPGKSGAIIVQYLGSEM